MNTNFYNYSIPGQFGFQRWNTITAYAIQEFHHYIMFFIIIILFFVFSLIFLNFHYFYFNNQLTFKDFLKLKKINNVNISHGAFLEIFWIYIPTLILICIAIPSFYILYLMEEYKEASILRNVIGHQWYWS